MEFTSAKQEQWLQIKEIYMEAFPKAERKPYFVLRHWAKKKKAIVMTASENGQVLGFVVLIPYKDMVMVDYLAVSAKIRSRGTGSFIMEQICRRFSGKKMALLIERPDDTAPNREQRTARRKFYMKNGFTSADLFVTGASGEMEVLNRGGRISKEKYLSLQKYALGKILFKLSRIKAAYGKTAKTEQEKTEGQKALQ